MESGQSTVESGVLSRDVVALLDWQSWTADGPTLKLEICPETVLSLVGFVGLNYGGSTKGEWTVRRRIWSFVQRRCRLCWIGRVGLRMVR